jgi:uncharacterized protein (DUF1501 family)
MLTRRRFLQQSGIALAVTGVLPSFLTRAAQAAAEGGVTTRYGSDTMLVVIQLQGGNDGLNTVVPYGLDGYAALRPQIGIKDPLPITDSIGLHPSLGPFQSLYQAGKLAIIQGVGYPNPNLSHFRATDIWLTAAPDSYAQQGWLATYMAGADTGSNPIYAASVTDGLNRALYGKGVTVPSVSSIDSFQFRTDPRYAADRAPQLAYVSSVTGLDYSGSPLQDHVARTTASAIVSSERVQQAVQAYNSTVQYPQFSLANSLKTVAQLMAGNLGTRIFYTQFGGFDTHSGEVATHNRLLPGFANSVDAFLQDVAAMGLSDKVLIMTFSEFGRRPQENASGGTDHGTSEPMFVIGNQVQGGLIGEHPSLTSLDDNRNLKFNIDFRSVYATVLENWLGAPAEQVLGARYENVGFI